MTKYNTTEQPIDVVILWVNGNEDKHLQKILPYVKVKEKIKTKKFRTRFDQVNEIKYTVDSILKFAPYIRSIYIITDEQTPEFLTKKNANTTYKNVSIVDHKVIFSGYEQYLPVFNSRSIETCMYRIPGLAELFIYFNDDFFLINKTRPNDFFKNGLPILRGKWLKFDENIFYKRFKKTKKTGHKKAQQKAAKLVGLNKYYNFRHTPHPMRKSTFEKYFNENKDVFLNNIEYKFRNKNQFIPQGLANHLEIKNNSCFFNKDLRLMYFRSYKKSLFWYKFKLNKKSKNKLFLALQSLDLCPENIQTYILNWLKKRVI